MILKFVLMLKFFAVQCNYICILSNTVNNSIAHLCSFYLPWLEYTKVCSSAGLTIFLTVANRFCDLLQLLATIYAA